VGAVPATAPTCGDEFIGDEGIGRLSIGTRIDSLRAVCKVIRDTTVRGSEGMMERRATVSFASDTVTAEIVDDRVWRIRVTSPRFRSRDSLGVGTPLKRLLALDDPRGLTGEGRLVLVSPDHCGLSFGLSQTFPGAPPEQIRRAEFKRLPQTTTVKDVLIIGCPND
jgi:hypothetical protein